MKNLRTGMIGLVVMVLMMSAVGCGKNEDDSKAKSTEKKNPIVTMEMASGGKIEIELYPNIAPNTVANFVSLVKSGFYDGLTFHRIVAGFMIQGGDPDGTGTGGPGYGIKGEFSSNGFKNSLAHEKGVISMARSEDPNSAGSQFFIVTETATSLDGNYAAFGKVINGIETLDAIENVEVTLNEMSKELSVPVVKQVIKQMTVDTFGVDYGEPKKVGQ